MNYEYPLPSGKSSMMATWRELPAHVAKCSGVRPSLSSRCFSAPNLRSSAMASPPASAAMWHADTKPRRHVAFGLAPAFNNLEVQSNSILDSIAPSKLSMVSGLSLRFVWKLGNDYRRRSAVLVTRHELLGLPLTPPFLPILPIESKSAQVVQPSSFWSASAPMAIPRFPFISLIKKLFRLWQTSYI